MFQSFRKIVNSISFFKPTARKCFSTHPLIFKKFSHESDPSKTFLIKQLEEKEIEEAANCIAEAYSHRENIFRSLKLPSEQLFKCVKQDLEFALPQDLAFVCKDLSNGKVAGVAYYDDLSYFLYRPTFLNEEMVNNFEKWAQLEEFYKYCFAFIETYAIPTGPNDILHLRWIAADRAYSKYGIGNYLMQVDRCLHPKITKARRKIIVASNETNFHFCSKNGWELLQKINYRDFRDKKNNRPFENIAKMEEVNPADAFVYILKMESTSTQSCFAEIRKN